MPSAGSAKVTTPGEKPYEGQVYPRFTARQGIFTPAGQQRQLTVRARGPATVPYEVAVGYFDSSDRLIRYAPKKLTGSDAFETVTIPAPSVPVDCYQCVLETTGPDAAAADLWLDNLQLVDVAPTVTQPVLVAEDGLAQLAQVWSRTFTVPAGLTNAVLYVVQEYDSAGRPISSAGVSWNGAAMELVSKPAGAAGLEVWRLKNPTAGAGPVAFSHTNTVQGVLHIYLFSDVDQTTPETVATPVISSNALHPTISVTPSSTEVAVAALVIGATSTTTLTQDSGPTSRYNAKQFSGGFGIHGAGATMVGAGAPVTFGWVESSAGAGSPSILVAFRVRGAAAAPPAAPTNSAAPAVVGSATQGETLAARAGTWTGATSFSYQWQAETAAGSGVYTDLADETSPTLLLRFEHVGLRVRVNVTGYNTGGQLTVTSAAAGPASGVAPVIDEAPILSGGSSIGDTLTTSNGVWDNGPTGYSYQWQRQPAGGSFADITGETAATYTIAADDDNYLLRCNVTATNAAGSATASSAARGPVGPAGVLDDFNRPDASPIGAPYTSPIENGAGTIDLVGYKARWAGDGVSGQAALTTVGDADLFIEIPIATAPAAGKGIAAWLRVQNAGNDTTARGYLASYIVGTGVTVYKLLNGHAYTAISPVVAQTIAEDEALRGEIVGSTITVYRVDAAGVKHAIDFGAPVTDTDITGAGAIGFEINDTSAEIDNLKGGEFNVDAPTSTIAPTVTAPDGYHVGDTVTATTGDWTGSPSSFAYQWQADDTDIPGATGTSYVIQQTDVGKAIRVGVVATNRAGDSAPAYSGESVDVVAREPVNVTPPGITGRAIVGQQLVCVPGFWTGDPPPTFSYQWQRSFDNEASWTDIPDATDRVRTLGESSLGALIRCHVTASNGATATADTDAVGPVENVQVPPPPPPVFTNAFATELFEGLQPLEEALP